MKDKNLLWETKSVGSIPNIFNRGDINSTHDKKGTDLISINK
jgi:hypothetical protein